jgi:hypothetical protein
MIKRLSPLILALCIGLGGSAAAQTQQVKMQHDALMQGLKEIRAEQAVSLQVEEDCQTCFESVLVFPAAARSADQQVCFENPFLQLFEAHDGRTLTGTLTTAVLEGSAWLALPETILIEAEGSAGQQFVGELCAPAAIEANGQTFQIRQDSSRDDILAPAIGGAAVGAMAGTVGRRRQSLSGLLLGMRDRHAVQIEIRSEPAGADVFVNGKATPFRTNSVLSVPKEWLSAIQVKFKQVSRRLRTCDDRPGEGRSALIFWCRFAP